MYRLIGFSLIFFCSTVFADDDCCNGKFQLNQIAFTESAERWVVAEKALVTMGVDANLTETGLTSLQDDVMAKLKTFSKEAKWRITQNYRRQDQSGLESVHIEAEARLPESQLAKLREQAKKVSKPGFKVKVQNIEYRPTNAETENVKSQVRNDLYTQVKAELDRLNRLYPKQNYFINQMSIGDGDVVAPLPRTQMMAVGTSDAMMKQARVGSGNANPGVSKKIKLTASVILGSQIDS